MKIYQEGAILRIVIIGAVAAGTSAATKARRNNEEAQIVIYEKDSFISYSGCGMPYHIGGEIQNADDLTPRDPAFFKDNYNVDIYTLHEVMSINPNKKTVLVKNLPTGHTFTDHYDKLLIATGAKSSIPPIQGIDRKNVFALRNINDMNHIIAFINNNSPKSAAVIGTGFIGLEVCENLKLLGMDVTLIERLPQVTPGLDSDMAVYVEDHIRSKGVEIFIDASATHINEDGLVLSDGSKINADLVIIATGVRPNVELATEAGVELGQTGAIKVNTKMQTNMADIYSCGDCTEQFHIVSGKPVYRPLGSTANKTGRIAGDSMTGGDLEFRGVLGTGIFRVFDLAVGQTGLSEKEAIELGYDVVVAHNTKPDRPEYMGGKEMTIKAIADKKTGRLLGVQIVGHEGVDKRTDVFVTAITFKAKVGDLFHLDLAYSPPFSTAKDPVMYTGMILDNAMNKGRKLITPNALKGLIKSGKKLQILDHRSNRETEQESVELSDHVLHSDLRSVAKSLDKELKTVTYCNKGVTANAAQNILINQGFKEVYNLSGGYKHYSKLKDEE